MMGEKLQAKGQSFDTIASLYEVSTFLPPALGNPSSAGTQAILPS
jgi:hypothetical protein